MAAAARAPVTAAFRAAAAAWAATVAFFTVCSKRREVRASVKIRHRSCSCPPQPDTPQQLQTRLGWGAMSKGAFMSCSQHYHKSVGPEKTRSRRAPTDLPGIAGADSANVGVARGQHPDRVGLPRASTTLQEPPPARVAA